jgi:uncharacterized protein (DUF1778 family)
MGSTIRGLGRRALLHIRVNEAERKTFDEAAAISGLSISSYCRMVLRKAAIADLNAANRKVDL